MFDNSNITIIIKKNISYENAINTGCRNHQLNNACNTNSYKIKQNTVATITKNP